MDVDVPFGTRGLTTWLVNAHQRPPHGAVSRIYATYLRHKAAVTHRNVTRDAAPLKQRDGHGGGL